MEILYTIHAFSIIGGALFMAGLVMLAYLYFNNEISYGKLKMKGGAHRSKKWPTMFYFSIGFLVVGASLFGYGFTLPRPQNTTGLIKERSWYGTWDIEFQNDCSTAAIFNDASTVKFYQYLNKGESVFEGLIQDAEGGKIGSFQRLGSSMGSEDFRVIKGQCKINGGKSILVELALHGSREVFSGVVYESKSANKYTCWGKKR
jgi:hypothetical protein